MTFCVEEPVCGTKDVTQLFYVIQSLRLNSRVRKHRFKGDVGKLYDIYLNLGERVLKLFSVAIVF